VEEFKWPAAMLGFVMLLIYFEWRVASRKKGGVNAVDRKMMRGMFGVGVALAAIVWLLQDLA
jgi:small-conductance mechanosensitive channel